MNRREGRHSRSCTARAPCTSGTVRSRRPGLRQSMHQAHSSCTGRTSWWPRDHRPPWGPCNRHLPCMTWVPGHPMSADNRCSGCRRSNLDSCRRSPDTWRAPGSRGRSTWPLLEMSCPSDDSSARCDADGRRRRGRSPVHRAHPQVHADADRDAAACDQRDAWSADQSRRLALAHRGAGLRRTASRPRQRAPPHQRRRQAQEQGTGARQGAAWDRHRPPLAA